jgi:hypothetical protein
MKNNFKKAKTRTEGIQEVAPLSCKYKALSTNPSATTEIPSRKQTMNAGDNDASCMGKGTLIHCWWQRELLQAWGNQYAGSSKS